MAPTDLEVSESQVEKLMFKACCDFIITLRNAGVTPKFVFDGSAKFTGTNDFNVSALKYKTLAERQEKRDDKEQNVAALRQKLLDLSPLERTGELMQQYHKALESVGSIRPLILKIKELLTALDVEWIQAKFDAERVCSMLSREGGRCAVFSNDTDNIAYGAPIMITGFSKLSSEQLRGYGCGYNADDPAVRKNTRCVDYFDFRVLLTKLNGDSITEKSFREFCIMLGNDYNTRIYNVGPAKAFDHIKNYKEIDNPNAAGKYDIKCLDLENCRKIFNVFPSSNEIVTIQELQNKFGAQAVIPGVLTKTCWELLNYADISDYADKLRFSKAVLAEKLRQQATHRSASQIVLKVASEPDVKTLVRPSDRSCQSIQSIDRADQVDSKMSLQIPNPANGRLELYQSGTASHIPASAAPIKIILTLPTNPRNHPINPSIISSAKLTI